MYVFAAVIRKNDDGGYWAEVPDLEGCFGQGDDFMDAVSSISNGLETHLAAMLEYGIDIPKPSVVKADDGDVIYVSANPCEYTLQVETVSAAEAARMLGVSPGRVSQLIRCGRLKAKRSPEGTEVTRESVDEYSSTRRGAGRPKVAAMV